MIPRLYPANVDLQYTPNVSNGFGHLSEAASCLVTYRINGECECSLVYPVTGKRFSQLTVGAIILAQKGSGYAVQPFRIYRISKPINGLVTCYGRHALMYDLQGILVEPFQAVGIVDAYQKIAQNALSVLPYQFATNLTDTSPFEITQPMSIWECIRLLVEQYGGEIDLQRYYLRHRDRLGSDDGKVIQYRKNLVDLSHETNIGEFYTAVFPWWADDENYVHGSIQTASGTFPVNRVYSLDCSDAFEDAPTAAQLNTYAQDFILSAGIGIPTISMRVKHIDLEGAEQIRYGDTVTVKYPALGVETIARATGGVWNCLAEKYEDMTIGKESANVADTIAAQSNAIGGQGSELAAINSVLAVREYSTTYSGLSIYACRTGNTVAVEVDGTPSSALATSAGYVDLATFPKGWAPRRTRPQPELLSTLYVGQLYVGTNRVLRIGYTKKIADGSAVDMSAQIHAYFTYIVG